MSADSKPAGTRDVAGILAGYRLPDKIPFGVELAPVMYRAEYRDGEWQPGSLVSFADVPVSPASTALQFAQQAFEGMLESRSQSCSLVSATNWGTLGVRLPRCMSVDEFDARKHCVVTAVGRKNSIGATRQPVRGELLMMPVISHHFVIRTRHAKQNSQT